MDSLSPRLKLLFSANLLFSLAFWIGLAWILKQASRHFGIIAGIDFNNPEQLIALYLGAGLLMVLARFLVRVRQLARIRGHAVAIGGKQFPDLARRLSAVCKRLQVENLPRAYLFNDPKLQRSHSLKLFGQSHLALQAEIISAFTERQSAIDFVIGYELARSHDPLNAWQPLLAPAAILPLLGAAYARARIYHYDRIGLAACKTKVDAAFALAILATGGRRWKSLNIPQFASQSTEAAQFWNSLNELQSDSPWLTKRMAHLRAAATQSDAFVPRHHPLAYAIGLLIPHTKLTSINGPFRLLGLALWILLAGLSGQALYQFAEQQGWLQRLQSAPAVTLGQQDRPKQRSKNHPYDQLDADLRALGQNLRKQYKKTGGNPCAIKRLKQIKLNYSASRYSFDCNKPLVYTHIEIGEFIPGTPTHIRSYHWQQDRMLSGQNTGTSD
ncbi:MAG: M48 family metallopeptidase [Gammaproteobacteria bacterium]|nr:MAG: M48 family metallopeptidase [Gammaproteobacteria bacterium]